MKKIIAILLILTVGLFILGGCSTTETSEDEQQTQTPESQQSQQPAEGEEIPQPPALPKD